MASIVPLELVTVSGVVPAVLVPEAAMTAWPLLMHVELKVTVTGAARIEHSVLVDDRDREAGVAAGCDVGGRQADQLRLKV